jgi:hypothetical protein
MHCLSSGPLTHCVRGERRGLGVALPTTVSASEAGARLLLCLAGSVMGLLKRGGTGHVAVARPKHWAVMTRKPQ